MQQHPNSEIMALQDSSGSLTERGKSISMLRLPATDSRVFYAAHCAAASNSTTPAKRMTIGYWRYIAQGPLRAVAGLVQMSERACTVLESH